MTKRETSLYTNVFQEGASPEASLFYFRKIRRIKKPAAGQKFDF